MDSDVLRR